MNKAIARRDFEQIKQSIHQDLRAAGLERLSRGDPDRARAMVTRARLSVSLDQYQQRVADHLEAAYHRSKDTELVVGGVVVRYDKAQHAKDEWTLRCLYYYDDGYLAFLSGGPPPLVPFKPGQTVARDPDGTISAPAQRLCYRAGELNDRARKEAQQIMKKVGDIK